MFKINLKLVIMLNILQVIILITASYNLFSIRPRSVSPSLYSSVYTNSLQLMFGLMMTDSKVSFSC